MRKLVWMDGTEVCVVEHALMVVEEKEHELLVLKTGDDEGYVKQCASRSSLLNGACRTIDVYSYRTEWGQTTGWVKVAAYRRGVLVGKVCAARA